MTKVRGASGTVLDIDEARAYSLVQGGHAEYVDPADAPASAPTGEPTPDAIGDETAAHPQQQAARAEESDQVSESEAEAPGAKANRQDLVDYAVDQGIVGAEDELQGKTKDEIRELIDSSGE